MKNGPVEKGFNPIILQQPLNVSHHQPSFHTVIPSYRSSHDLDAIVRRSSPRWPCCLNCLKEDVRYD